MYKKKKMILVKWKFKLNVHNKNGVKIVPIKSNEIEIIKFCYDAIS